MLYRLWKRFLRVLPKNLIWRLGAQNVEYRFHKNVNEWRRSDAFMQQTRDLFGSWGYSEEDFAGALIVDLGCGPKLRSKFFKAARIVAVDPLADKYRSGLEWSDLDDAEQVYSYPAERRIESISGQVRFVMCINVLDHVYNYVDVLRNVYDMLQPGGAFLLSVDLHDIPSVTHPVNLNKPTLLSATQQVGFKLTRELSTAALQAESYGEGKTYTAEFQKP